MRKSQSKCTTKTLFNPLFFQKINSFFQCTKTPVYLLNFFLGFSAIQSDFVDFFKGKKG